MSDEQEQLKLQNKSNRLFASIQLEVGKSTMDLITELIENEIELEQLCNQ